MLWKPRPLQQSEREVLWTIATAIYETWQLDSTDKDPFAHHVSHLYSTWCEHVNLRAQPSAQSRLPSYVGEYENAINIATDLMAVDPAAKPAAALQRLLFARPKSSGTSPTSAGIRLDTPLLHAKRYVVDEFITVLIVGGGFRQFAGWNYNGFIGGSRFDQVNAIVQPLDQVKAGAAR